MDPKTHWEKVYSTKAPNQVSWYRPHLETSLALIHRAAGVNSASIIDVGGGESTLVDDLLARGYQNITVLDVSQTAIDVTKKRLGSAAEQVTWLVADISKVQLLQNAYDVWHDRAVFHFLTSAEDRTAYVRQAAHAVRPGGRVSSARSAPKVPQSAAGSMWHVMTQIHCTNNSAFGFDSWIARKKYIRLPSGRRSNFCIVTAEWKKNDLLLRCGEPVRPEGSGA